MRLFVWLFLLGGTALILLFGYTTRTMTDEIGYAVPRKMEAEIEAAALTDGPAIDGVTRLS